MDSIGAGSVARQIMGTTVIGGMPAATAIAIFIIPALFVWSSIWQGIAAAKYRVLRLLRSRAHPRETKVTKLTALLLIVLLSAGCAVGPDYKRPSADVPGTYRGAMPKRRRSLRRNRSETKNGGRCFKISSFKT